MKHPTQDVSSGNKMETRQLDLARPDSGCLFGLGRTYKYKGKERKKEMNKGW